MTRAAWSASGRRGPAPRGARAVGSWGASIERARAAWDGLTGGPGVGRCVACGAHGGPEVGLTHGEGCAGGPVARVYSDRAAGAILGAALALWSDTAAAMDSDG